MRSLGGCDLWLTLDLDLDNRRVLTINPSLHVFGVHFPACGFRGRSHCPGCSLESLRRWNHLDGLQEWTRASSIWTLRVQGVFVEICSLYSRPNQDSGVSPCYLKPPLANMGCSASFASPALHAIWDALLFAFRPALHVCLSSFRFHPGNSHVCKPIPSYLDVACPELHSDGHCLKRSLPYLYSAGGFCLLKISAYISLLENCIRFPEAVIPICQIRQNSWKFTSHGE